MRSLSRSPARSLALLVVLGAACGGAKPPPADPGAGAAAPKASAAKEPAEVAKDEGDDPASRRIPTACADGDGKVCMPPSPFVKRLCGGFHPDVALALFAKGTPFTRGYLSRDTEAWDASGGASSSGKLVFEEEVLILFHRVPDTGGMVVSGVGGGYDVLRWDGTCASLTAEEVRLKVPSSPKFALIPWKSLDEKTRAALEADEKVGKAIAERRKECKGATMGEVTAKCEKADKKMSAAIVEFVRGGGALPAPGPLP
jgi:hypothetical protein